jgi:hypothetical protein
MTERLRNAKGGRPRKAEGERRDASLPPVRVTTAELVHVEEQAERAGLPVSEYVRRRALGAKVAPRQTPADTRALDELNRIGVNLNQLAHAANMGKTLEGQLAATLDQLQRQLEKVAGNGS